MKNLDQYLEQARASEYFSGARLGHDLKRFLAEHGDACERLAHDISGKRIFLVGSGGSMANLSCAKYVFDHLTRTPVEVLAGYELIWRDPPMLDGDSVAFFASYSGETEDTVAALRFAVGRGARTVALVKSVDSTIGREADLVIPYGSAAIFEAPFAALVLVAARLAGRDRGSAAEEIRSSLLEVPAAAHDAVEREAGNAEERARRFLTSRHLYVLGAGPNAPLAYKVALTVVMENIRIGGTFCDAAEFRHGPAEAMERTPIDAMVLLGTDASREMTLRTLAFLEENGARTLVYDAAEVASGVHPLLTPLVLNSLTQWFVVYSAILRGITDLDERVFMGRNVLATAGHSWP